MLDDKVYGLCSFRVWTTFLLFSSFKLRNLRKSKIDWLNKHLKDFISHFPMMCRKTSFTLVFIIQNFLAPLFVFFWIKNCNLRIKLLHRYLCNYLMHILTHFFLYNLDFWILRIENLFWIWKQDDDNYPYNLLRGKTNIFQGWNGFQEAPKWPNWYEYL